MRATLKTRAWNRIHAQKSDKRRLKSKEKLKAKRRERNYKFQPKSTIKGQTATYSIKCPEDFSLESNFKGVMQVLGDIRKYSGRDRNERPYIDFRDIRNLSLPAALTLAAELYRWNHLSIRKNRKLQTVDVGEWEPKVRRLLADIGFFELLQAQYPKDLADKDAHSIDTRYVKYRTGNKADGEAFYRLREEELENVAGELPRKQYLYAAVTEAMINVVQHAYESDNQRSSQLPNWWLSASYNKQDGCITIMIYDQGAGIPKTLPRKFGERIREYVIDDDAHMIQAAHELSRTASGLDYRGHGLERDVRGYFKDLDCEGHYRVISLKGEYLYKRDAEGEISEDLKNHKSALYGTLIEWKLTIPC